MNVDLFTILEATENAQAIISFLNFVEEEEESIGVKLDRLMKSELETGMRELQQASMSATETQSLLREARSRFNKALNLEKGVRQVVAHLGLSLCHAQLGDSENALSALKEILAIETYEPPTLKAGAIQAGVTSGAAFFATSLFFTPVAGVAAAVQAYRIREARQRKLTEEAENIASLQDRVRRFIAAKSRKSKNLKGRGPKS